MTAREEILAQVRARARHATPPPVWRSSRHFSDLAGRFAEALTAAKGELFRTGSLEAALEQLGDILQQLGADRVVVNSEPPLADVDVAARWPGIQWHIVGQSDGDLRDFCEGADVGLSGSDAALAETGSIILSSGPGRSRLATLLPAIHVALLPTSCLTTDIFTWTAARHGQLPANTILVSGPSKTGDIEQTMTTGVHGPRRFIVILFDDTPASPPTTES